MATEICKICGQESTPWEYLIKLEGHICVDCSNKLRPEEKDLIGHYFQMGKRHTEGR